MIVAGYPVPWKKEPTLRGDGATLQEMMALPSSEGVALTMGEPPQVKIVAGSALSHILAIYSQPSRPSRRRARQSSDA
jgi:hypothetical protein